MQKICIIADTSFLKRVDKIGIIKKCTLADLILRSTVLSKGTTISVKFYLQQYIYFLNECLKSFFWKCSKNQAPNLCQKPSKAVGNLLRLSLYQPIFLNSNQGPCRVYRKGNLPAWRKYCTTRYDGSHLYQPLTGSNHPTTTIVHLEGGGGQCGLPLFSPLQDCLMVMLNGYG